MESVDDIRRKMSDRSGETYQPRQKRQRPARSSSPAPAKPKRPVAPDGVSSLAQNWFDRGEALGFDFPYDVNYFALALDEKIKNDPRFRKLRDRGEGEKVDRWVTKMIEIWWSDGNDPMDPGGYLTNAITARNAKEYFLGEDWEDVQEYARSSLRAKYLKEHGRVRPKPDITRTQQVLEELDKIEKDGQMRRYLAEVDLDAEPPQLDDEGRERLRSWREKRRST